MLWFSLLPLFLGITVVTQGTLNRESGGVFGLISAVFINAFVFLGLSFLLWIFATRYPQFFPDHFVPKNSFKNIQLIHLVPGICGFLLVLGLPWSMRLLGTSRTLILLVSSQILCGLLIDVFYYETSLKLPQILGAILTVSGISLILL